MLALERRKRILEKVQTEHKVIVSRLAEEFEVSEETIRRDLDKMEEEGHVIKSYGGAIANEKDTIELPFNVRRNANPEGKRKIASLVAKEVEEGEHIFLDASTTAVYIARELKRFSRLTVITNSIENLVELSDMPGWNVIATGGTLSGGSMSLLGGKAVESILSYNADKVFLSCKGLSREKGATDGSEELAGIKRSMLEASGKVYIAADNTKFDHVAFSQICGLDRADALITDEKPDDLWLRYFQENKVQCLWDGKR